MGFTKLIENTNTRNMFSIIYFLLVIITIDSSVVRISAFIGTIYYFQDFYNVLFICTAISFGFIQFFILRVLIHKHIESMVHKKMKLHILSKLAVYATYGMIAILITIILEMYIISRYNILFIFVIVWITYGMTLIMLSFLSFMFFRWFKHVRTRVILAYASAILMLSTNTVITIIFMSVELGSLVSRSLRQQARFCWGIDLLVA
jgi:hypothetical protein